MFVHDDAQGLHALGFEGKPVAVPQPGAPGLAVSQAVPNPARGGVSVQLSLPEGAFVSATVHDLAGRRVGTVHSGPLQAGTHELAWSARIGSGPAPPGVYFLEVRVGGASQVRRLVVLR